MSFTALDGASKYLNNLLLSRGFLQDGTPIDFATLADSDSTTTARVINLIHDLVLRRDRDAEQRESLTVAIHALRSDDSQRVLDIQKLQDKNVQLKSELSTAEARERNALASVKREQTRAKELKEQMAKMKSTLDQVRAKCTNDVRKRDVELEKLRGHLNGLGRGKKEGAGGMKVNVLNVQQQQRSASLPVASQDPNATGWCLENETNDFLAAVVNETSTENVALRKIVGDSMRYLKALSGLEEERREKDDAIGIPGQYRDRDTEAGENLVPVKQLASAMSDVLAHVQTVLRDPSFVPIEEVQTRDEEIAKLRSGWEKIADRWKEAVSMMTQWRRQVMNEEESTEEAHAYLEVEPVSFSRSIATRPNGVPVLDPIVEEELTSMLMEHYSRIGNQSALSNAPQAGHDQFMHDETLPEPEQTGTPRPQLFPTETIPEPGLFEDAPLATPAKRGIKLHKHSHDASLPLSNSNANAKKRRLLANQSSPRKKRSISPLEEQDHAQTAFTDFLDSVSDPLQLENFTPDDSADEEEGDDLFVSQSRSNLRHRSKLPRMTVAEKLAVVEAEATEATEVIRRRQATTYDANDKRHKDRARRSMAKAEDIVPVNGSDRQSGRTKKAKDRRRSTLTPAELGTLMGR